MRKTSFVLWLALLVVGSLSVASAHPGRTAADGCHYCRTNCDSWWEEWNVRHCHGGSSEPVNTNTTSTTNTYNTYTPTTTTQQAPPKPVVQCPSNSHDAGDGTCTCEIGYKSTISGEACEIDHQYECNQKYRWTTYNATQDKCLCASWYELKGSECVAIEQAPTSTTKTADLAVTTPIATTKSSTSTWSWYWWLFSAVLIGWWLVFLSRRNARKKSK